MKAISQRRAASNGSDPFPCRRHRDIRTPRQRTGRVLTTPALYASLLLAFLVAGCGSTSVADKVADRYDVKVRSCRAVGLVEEGKIYSCQTDRSTVCVIVDGGDVFDATGRAQALGVSC